MSITFKTTELFTFEQFEEYVTSIDPMTKIDNLVKVLKNYLLATENNTLYLLNEHIVYEYINTIKFYNIITGFLSQSYKNLDKCNKKCVDALRGIGKSFDKTYIDKLIPLIIGGLYVDNIKFDNYGPQIHFKNGYIDLKTNKFMKRVIGTDYITYCIDRDYVESTLDDRKQIRSHLNKIYPNKIEREYIFMIFGSALSSYSLQDRSLLFLLGKTSAGKSVMLELLKSSFGHYVKELGSSTFCKNNDKKSKVK